MSSVVTAAVGRLILLPTLVIAAAILVKGYADVGDGFSAGVIAALGPLVRLYGDGDSDRPLSPGRERLSASLSPCAHHSSFIIHHSSFITYSGLMLTLLVSFAPLISGEAPITHLSLPGQHVIHLGAIALHTALLFDLGVFLVIFGFITSVAHALYRAGRPSVTPEDRP